MLGWRNCWRISASRSNRCPIVPLWSELAAHDLDGGGFPVFSLVPR